MTPFKLILASKSPRRHELLGHLSANFEIRIKEIEEIYPTNLAAKEVPIFLAQLKANAFKNDLNEGEVVLTSDTVVALNNQIYGKPLDRAHAIKILTELSGKQHEVITGVCLLSREKEIIFSETTKVFFKQLSLAEIEYYVDAFMPYDKAGAYAIQEWIGMIGIEKIEGDYFNVVGLPLFKLNEALKTF